VRAGLVAACLVGLAGCLDSLEPDVGPPARALCSDADSDPSVAVRYQADLVDGIFNRAVLHCDKCHTPGGATPIGLLVSGLDLSTYDSLRAGGVQSGGDIVIPGQPCRSLLYQKVQAGPPFGARMPLDGPPYLRGDELRLVADWIAEGAHND